MKSLSRRFLFGVGVTSLVVTVLASVGAYFVFQRELSQRQIGYLERYVQERGANVDRRFSNLAALHQAAASELERRMKVLSRQDVERLSELYFPVQADGTRRSRPELFDGVMTSAGGYIYGMGAFIRNPDQASATEMKALVAAVPLVATFGQAARSDYDNFYFFTPATRLVMFGPDRPDRLMFYRRDAPADLVIAGEEMAQITLPQNDPRRVTRCTNLQRLVQENEGARVGTGCITPAYIDGRYVGAFGSSIELTGFFQDAIRDVIPGAASMIMTTKGELIAYPGLEQGAIASEDTITAYEHKLGLRKIAEAVRRDGQRYGVVEGPNNKNFIAYGKLSGPDWYLLLSYPKAAVAASAARSASWILLLGAIACALQTYLIIVVARRAIVNPIRRLAVSCEPDAFGDGGRPNVSDIERRNDEIGVLATALKNERGKVEAVLASLEDRVQERTAQLERANAEKSRFLANMSHELRTPLNGVIAISENLAQEQTTPRSRELAELIVSSGRLLERVLTDILDFSKIEAGEITLASDTFRLETLVGRIAELHRASAESKGLAFVWSVSPEARGTYAGDSVRLTQVLSNLLSNAVKFTESGSVRLDVVVESEQVRFSVIDTGIGFDEDVRARLFRRFEQADASIRRRFGGTGLGLAISRSLIELMNGHVDVFSTPGVGSTFTFMLPLARSAGEETTEPETTEIADIAQLRVLLAEDHPTNQKVVQLILQSVGIEPVIVDNGREALERLSASSFDVVLMDMQMPELDGLAATAQLRRMERDMGRPRTPVVMLTANALDEHVRASLEAGADRHLSKPIRAASLIACIVGVLGGDDEPAGGKAQVA